MEPHRKQTEYHTVSPWIWEQGTASDWDAMMARLCVENVCIWDKGVFADECSLHCWHTICTYCYVTVISLYFVGQYFCNFFTKIFRNTFFCNRLEVKHCFSGLLSSLETALSHFHLTILLKCHKWNHAITYLWKFVQSNRAKPELRVFMYLQILQNEILWKIVNCSATKIQTAQLRFRLARSNTVSNQPQTIDKACFR